MIDVEAANGDMPKYDKDQKAQLCGFASHMPPSGKGGEMIKRIFRDDFCLWGHINNKEEKQVWKILPMYFIPHGRGIVGLTNVIDYKFPPQQTGPTAKPVGRVSRRVRIPDPAPDLQPVGLEDGNDPLPADPLAGAKVTKGTEDNAQLMGPGLQFSKADEEPESAEEVAKEQELFEHPLTEADFGEEAAAADAAAANGENDW